MSIRFFLHCHDKNDWKLRDMKRHPNDPCWEEGKYTRCHKDVRQLLEKHDRVIDVVVEDKKPIVRSAFEISNVEGSGESRKLYFDEYYFASNNPIELEGHFIRYRKMKFETYVKKGGNSSLWEKITQSYPKYGKGKKPSIIDQRLWDDMIAKRKENESAKDCHTC